uniref:Uncharacterized protein n=1 Tax=Favella ehrenbergii TaxID=182087 RepID=A0A7S3MMQ3_9SPIT|mmetsp:Transcript_1997/g.2741  ORF Transcript_1997/g.2741 Transcript_1997/m.2741 type:complete len:222 (+) Transcript_1997:909-1574(+)
MPFPFHERGTRLLNAPQVDELALAGDGHLLAVLPLDLQAFEVGVDNAVVEASHLAVLVRGAVPDVDFAHEATRGDEVVCLVAEFTLHEILIEVLGAQDLDVAVYADFPHAGNHVARAREQLVTRRVPMDGAHGLVLLVLVLGQYVRDLHLFKIWGKVLTPQIPQMREVSTACRRQQTTPRVELRAVHLFVLTGLSEVDSEVVIVLEGLHDELGVVQRACHL